MPRSNNLLFSKDPKCNDLAVTYGGVVAHKNQQTGVSNKKRFRHI